MQLRKTLKLLGFNSKDWMMSTLSPNKDGTKQFEPREKVNIF